jgi:hypothetical protein
MDNRNALTAGLPARRDDEPQDLRDDIVDELADHLACAYRRELLRGADGATALRRVLEKFGDPAVVARRLWLDAMWGKIMTQRTLVVCCVVLAALSLMMALVLWNQAVRAQRMVQQEMAAAEAARREAEAARQQMLDQLTAISKSSSRPQSSGWIPVTFKLTQETHDGPPAVGFHVSLGRGQGGSTKPDAIRRVSDEKGIIDFGVVQPGDWEYRLARDFKPGMQWAATGSFNVTLVDRIERNVLCPRFSSVADVSMPLEGPINWKEQDLAVLAYLEHDGLEFQPGVKWELLSQSGNLLRRPGHFILVGEPEQRVKPLDPLQILMWATDHVSNTRAGTNRGATEAQKEYAFPHIHADVFDTLPEPRGQATAKDWFPGTYRTLQLMIVRPSKSQRKEPGRRTFDVIEAAMDQGKSTIIVGSGMEARVVREGSEISGLWRGINLDSLFPQHQGEFEARNGRPNTWTLRIPDALIKAVREKLKTEEATKK